MPKTSTKYKCNSAHSNGTGKWVILRVVCCTVSRNCTWTYHPLYCSILLYISPYNGGGTSPINITLYGHVGRVASYMLSPIHKSQLLSYERSRRPQNFYRQVHEKSHWNKRYTLEGQSLQLERTQL